MAQLRDVLLEIGSIKDSGGPSGPAEGFVQTQTSPIFCICLSAQWLESIEGMKSALQQKMLDLESEKVNACDLNSPQL